MRRPGTHGVAYRTLVLLQIISVATVGVVAFGQRAVAASDLSRWPAWLAGVIRFLNGEAWLLQPAAVAVGLVAQRLKKSVGEPKVWDTIKECLEKLRDEVFPPDTGALQDEHRVTLFRHRRLCWAAVRSWTFVGILVPEERSGHRMRVTPTSFRAPKNAPHKAEGIAGRAWAKSKVLVLSNLEPVSKTSRKQELRAYAKRTFVSEGWLAKWLDRNEGKLTPVSFCGIPVEVKGKPWGVIVLDSSSSDAVRDEDYQTYAHFGWFVGKLLEGA
jgi:hypothetical protein